MLIWFLIWIGYCFVCGEFVVSDEERLAINAANTIFTRHGFVGLALINDAYVDLTKSWLCQTKQFDSHKYVLLICSDAICFSRLERFRSAQQMSFVVVHLDFGAYTRSSNVDEKIDTDLSRALAVSDSDHSFWHWQTGRIKIIHQLLKNKISVFLFETDAVWFRCAFNEWNSESSSIEYEQNDLSGIQDGTGNQHMGFGFLRIQANSKTISLFENLKNIFDKSVFDSKTKFQSEQTILNELLQSSTDLSWNLLPRAAYVDGNFYLSELRRATSPSPIVINNNYVVGVEKKIARAIAWRHYFIDESGEVCRDDLVATMHDTLGWEPAVELSNQQLFRQDCWAAPGSPKWCRCCQASVEQSLAACRRDGFCTRLCVDEPLDLPEYCLPDSLSAPMTSQRLCANRYLLLTSDWEVGDTLTVAELRQHIATTLHAIVLAQKLRRTALIYGLPHHQLAVWQLFGNASSVALARVGCHMSFRAFVDLHSTIVSQLSAGFVQLEAATSAERCKKTPQKSFNVLRRDLDCQEVYWRTYAFHSSPLQMPVQLRVARPGRFVEWPVDATTTRHALQQLQQQHDPMLLVIAGDRRFSNDLQDDAAVHQANPNQILRAMLESPTIQQKLKM